MRRAFENLPTDAPWVVALSGGLDSVLLLHLAWRWRQAEGRQSPRQGIRVRALHINHGLLPQADDWATQCQAFCAGLGVPLQVVKVAVAGAAGPEDAARQARYRVFAQQLASGEALLLGHHADDQAETQLYRMMRGAGLTGLAGMPPARALGPAQLYRPLLSQTRQQLATLARQAQLRWLEDPSNQDQRYDRNFLRHQVMPLLQARWPGVSRRMAQNATHGREALALLAERAEDDAGGVVDPDSGDLLVAPLLSLSGPRRRNLLQWWLRRQGLTPLNEIQLSTGLTEFLQARDPAHASLAWDGLVLRSYQGRLQVFSQAALAASPEPALWRPSAPLGWAGGRLTATPVVGEGLAQADAAQANLGNLTTLNVTARQGGERIELAGGQHQPLKKWLQARRCPPWERALLPLLWVDGTLVAVADCWLHPRFRAGAGQPGWRLHWQAADFRAVYSD